MSAGCTAPEFLGNFEDRQCQELRVHPPHSNFHRSGLPRLTSSLVKAAQPRLPSTDECKEDSNHNKINITCLGQLHLAVNLVRKCETSEPAPNVDWKRTGLTRLKQQVE